MRVLLLVVAAAAAPNYPKVSNSDVVACLQEFGVEFKYPNISRVAIIQDLIGKDKALVDERMKKCKGWIKNNLKALKVSARHGNNRLIGSKRRSLACMHVCLVVCQERQRLAASLFVHFTPHLIRTFHDNFDPSRLKSGQEAPSANLQLFQGLFCSVKYCIDSRRGLSPKDLTPLSPGPHN